MEHKELTALITRAQSGDPKAIEEVLRAAHTSVSYQCRKLLRDPRDAEDTTQEVLLTIYSRLDKLKNPAAFGGWVNAITVNRCKNALTRNHVDLQFAEGEDGRSAMDDLEELDEQQVPDKALDNAETTRMIEEIVDGLPDAQRICTLMYYYDEMSVKDIAATLGVSENTVKSRLNYARKAVKEKVLDYEKKGVKLYSLSPLPFLLYFLHRAAAESANPVQASAMAKKVLELAAPAAGTSAAGEAAAASMAEGSGSAGGAAAAGTTAAAKGAAAGGLLSSMTAKVIAGVVIGLLAAGGIIGAVTAFGHNAADPEPIATTALETEAAETEPVPETEPPEDDQPLDIPDPVGSLYETVTEYDPNTYIARTTLITDFDNLEVYYEFPVFPITTPGTQSINDYFRGLRDAFFRDENEEIARALEYAREPIVEDPFYDMYHCTIRTYTDELTSVLLDSSWYMGGVADSVSVTGTFRSDTGEQLNVLDVLGCSSAELNGYLVQALTDEGILNGAALLDNVTQYPFYVENGAVLVGVDVQMYRGKYFVKLNAPLQAGDAPAVSANVPGPVDTNMLNSIAYYGDPARCTMGADQARAFADVIEAETAMLIPQSGGQITSYAALIDVGDGNPILFFAGGENNPFWDGSGYGSSPHTIGIWQYIGGQAVPFSSEQFNCLYWNGSQLLIEQSFGNTGYLYAYDVRNGAILETPSSTAVRASAPASSEQPRINGQPVTEGEVTAWMQPWLGTNAAFIGEAMDGGAGSSMIGMTRGADAAAALRGYAQS